MPDLTIPLYKWACHILGSGPLGGTLGPGLSPALPEYRVPETRPGPGYWAPPQVLGPVQALGFTVQKSDTHTLVPDEPFPRPMHYRPSNWGLA